MNTTILPDAPERRVPLPPSLAIWTGYLMSRAAQQCRELFQSLAAPLGVGPRQFGVLAVLGEGRALSQVEIGERLGVDRNTIVLLLDELEAAGFVRRERDPHDRRAHLVTLTEAGQTVLAQATELARQTNDEVLSPLSPAERSALHALLSRLF